MTSFATTLKDLREAAGLTLEELASRSGLCELSLRNYERGASMPTAHSLTLLAKALGVSLDAFAGCTYPADIRQRKRSTGLPRIAHDWTLRANLKLGRLRNHCF
jgi:transcriptional regulator with XRE-family HTH domain